MNLTKLLEKRNAVYGFCALWIVVFHTFRRISMPFIPVVTNFIGVGNMAVDIFFFYSGLCLSLSVRKHDYTQIGWGDYYKRRLIRILIPYLIVCVPYYLWAAIFEKSGGLVRKAALYFASLSSITFWFRGTQTTWYVYGILVSYLLFPPIYTYVQKQGKTKIILLLAAMVLFAVITAYVPIVKNSMIVWARLPIFTIGVLAGTGHIKEKNNPEKTELVTAVIVFVLLGTLTSVSELSESFTIPQVYRFLLYIPMTLAFLILVSEIGTNLRALAWIGGMSLEMYLIHITLLHPIKYYGIMAGVGYWLYLLLPAVSILLSWAVCEIEKAFLSKGGKT